ncbi:MAG: hypothetical protein ACTSP5_13030, partial [Candidatus Heimdallarchaeota archaeon]
RGKAITQEELETEITKTNTLIEKATSRKVSGMHSAYSFYQGMQGERERLQILWDCGIRFISSDGRGPGEKPPAPWKDQEGNFRQPYFYKNEGYPDLLEIPNQGYSDNYYRGLSKQSPVKMSLEEEIQTRIKDLEFAIKNNLVFAPAMHPWVTGLTDKDGIVITSMLEFAERCDMKIVSAKELNNIVITKE